MKLDGKAYDRNETIANSVRILCKHCFEGFNSFKSFKCVINDSQCVWYVRGISEEIVDWINIFFDQIVRVLC